MTKSFLRRGVVVVFVTAVEDFTLMLSISTTCTTWLQCCRLGGGFAVVRYLELVSWALFFNFLCLLVLDLLFSTMLLSIITVFFFGVSLGALNRGLGSI